MTGSVRDISGGFPDSPIVAKSASEVSLPVDWCQQRGGDRRQPVSRLSQGSCTVPTACSSARARTYDFGISAGWWEVNLNVPANQKLLKDWGKWPEPSSECGPHSRT
ncbi:hypothetical protein B0H14DRAFT_2571859 [Mycena olivaceomarginata]|nr:hypothetical protein B0H14DRAFT_2571859 [Mycena olivaceomarginata]